jgi:hypothetical protein
LEGCFYTAKTQNGHSILMPILHSQGQESA